MAWWVKFPHHVKQQTKLIKAALGRQGQADPWSSLARQSSLISKFQIPETVSKKKGEIKGEHSS